MTKREFTRRAPAARYDSESVKSLFDDMASTYGRTNLLSSFGFTLLWRHQVVESLPLESASCVVDLMSGMGELWRSLARSLPSSAQVIGVDFSTEMARRAPRDWPFRIDMRIADALMPNAGGAAGAADVVVSSFGLKTFDRDQQHTLAQRVAELLRPGGTLSFVEISVPPNALLRALFMFYLKRVIPVIGRVMLGNPDCYRMLGLYTAAFGTTAHFAACLRAAGLNVVETSHFFGCATGVRGQKPQAYPTTATNSPAT
jgi:ubiquinone/menaquinone biosynthesis C-methylase UbiE